MNRFASTLLFASLSCLGACSADETAPSTTTGVTSTGAATTGGSTTGSGASDTTGTPSTGGEDTASGTTETTGGGETTADTAGATTDTTTGGSGSSTDGQAVGGGPDGGASTGESPTFAPGENHPCQENEAPGSNDPQVDACVCENDTYCCDTKWDFLCVQKVTGDCGQSCDCETLPSDVTACTEDAQCTFCDDSNKCNGTWSCVDGQCAMAPPVTCDASQDAGCSKNTCVAGTGECTIQSDHASCDDEDPCTVDACGEGGICTNEALEGCGENPPCKAAGTPGSADEAVTACVCAQDAYCCTFAWDSSCVALAKKQCELVCDCATFEPEQTACQVDADCDFCDADDDKCNGTWVCSEGGQCVEATPVVCDGSANAGCVKNQCVPLTGACEMTPDHTLCDDGNPDTFDYCELESTSCSAQALSCENKCGDYDNAAPCQCDAGCEEFEDCCPDLCDHCASDPDLTGLCTE